MRRQPARAIVATTSWLVFKFLRKTMTGNSGKDWSTAEPSLMDGSAPHETRAVMRLHRAGWRGPKIMELLNYKGTRLVRELQIALDEEGTASRENRRIWDAQVPRGTV